MIVGVKTRSVFQLERKGKGRKRGREGRRGEQEEGKGREGRRGGEGREGKGSHSVVSDSLRPHGLLVHGIFQARVLEWVAVSFSGGSSQPRDRTRVSHIAGRRFTV